MKLVLRLTCFDVKAVLMLSCFDDKRYVLDDGISILAYFHKGININREY